MKKQQKQESQYHEILFQKKHEFAANHFIDKYNSDLNKEYKNVFINKVFGQYVHTNMFMYHLITNNGDRITALLSVFSFEPNQIHGYVDYVYTGHMKPLTAEKKLKQLDHWPSCGAFGRSSECEISQAQNLLHQHISEINSHLELSENNYQIVRCWNQIVEGANYFMHVISDTGKKASVGMYVPLDYGDFQEAQLNNDEQEEKLQFEITFCSKGHVSYY